MGALCKNPVSESGLFARCGRSVVNARPVGLPVSDKEVDQLPLILLGPVLGQRPVDFFDLPVFYLFVHPDQRLPGLGEKNGSAYWTVDPVDHSEKDIAPASGLGPSGRP